MPLDPSADDIARIDASLPPLPADRRATLAAAAGREPTDDAVVLAVQRDLDGLAAAAIAAGADADRVLTHVEHNLAVEGAESLSAEHLAALVQHGDGGELTATQAKTVLAEVVATGKDPAAIAKEKGFEAMDTGALEGIVDEVIAAHPDEWEDFRTGDDKARGKLTGFFMGKVMQASKGQADGKAATALLRIEGRAVAPAMTIGADVSSDPLMATFVLHPRRRRAWVVLGPRRRPSSARPATTPSRWTCRATTMRPGWSEYADAVVDAIGDRRGDLVLVAQSLGGFTAPLVADRAAGRAHRAGDGHGPAARRDRRRVVGQHRARRGDRGPGPARRRRRCSSHDVPPDVLEAAGEPRDQSGDTDGPALPARPLAGRAHAVPALHGRPLLPAGLDARGRPRPPRHRARRGPRRPLRLPQPARSRWPRPSCAAWDERTLLGGGLIAHR